jgi:AcrR family transcriptional regulator
MDRLPDPRLDATRKQALNAALSLLEGQGVLAVTHSAINRETGISRSTLYRHWPKLEDLRNAAFARAATGPTNVPPTNGPLRADLIWILGHLMTALNETPWGKIAPQVIAIAANEQQTRNLMRKWIEDRSESFEAVFDAAKARGEIAKEVSPEHLIEFGIASPYFRKLIAGRTLDEEWLESHVDMICRMATQKSA